jgi:hypothetical protein
MPIKLDKGDSQQPLKNVLGLFLWGPQHFLETQIFLFPNADATT